MILIMKSGKQYNLMGMWVVMQRNFCLFSLDENLLDHHYEKV